MVSKESGTGFGSSPVAGSDDGEVDSVAKTLIKDLELGESEWESKALSLEEALKGLDGLSETAFRGIGLDVSVACGLAGDWNLALKCVTRLVREGDDRLAAKIWRLRCLVESGRFAEGLALAQVVLWDSERLIHVNYLTGLAFEALGMKSQAILRFEAVRRQDPNYREVRFK